MFLFVASVCFLSGFGAAIALANKPGKFGGKFAKLLSSVRSISTDFSPIVGKEGLGQQSKYSNGRYGSGLITKEQIEATYESSSWQYLAYQDFKTSILARDTGMKTFPCIYATMGYRAGEHRYVFLESDNPAEPRNVRLIAPALREYLSIAPSLGSNTSLVIVAAPSDKEISVEGYNQTFWDMLRGLRIIDSQPWPEDVPEIVDNEKWTFCFDGQPIFPVMLTPAHSRRWSRHVSVPIIALQPKWVLDALLSTPEKRIAATEKVRKLLRAFDQIDISPDLTSYGEKGTSEARQLCLLDQNETSACPYSNLDR